MRAIVGIICLIGIGAYFLSWLTKNLQTEIPDEDELYSYSDYKSPSSCAYAVATAMCSGPKQTKSFKRQLKQATVMIKSLIIREEFFQKNNSDDLCTDLLILSERKENFERLLAELKRHGYNSESFKRVRPRFVPAIYPSSCVGFAHLHSPCASIRLFLDKILLNYDSVIYIDSDVIFLQNIGTLWKEIETFPPATWAAFGPDQYGVEYNYMPFYGKLGLNSGVAFLNLTRMRKTNFFTRIQTIKKMYSDTSTLPDQDFLNFYFYKNPGEIKYLNCGKNYLYIFCWKERSCERNGIDILHGTNRAFQLPLKEPLFRAIYRFFLRFRLDGRQIEAKSDFVAELESTLRFAENNYRNSSDCIRNVPYFRELILKNMT